MKAIIFIISAHGNEDATQIKVTYHVDNDVTEHLTSELMLPATLTDVQFNQSIIAHARAVLEGSAGTVFSVGDEILLANAVTFMKEVISVETDAAIVSAPSLNDQLNTLLTGGE